MANSDTLSAADAAPLYADFIQAVESYFPLGTE